MTVDSPAEFILIALEVSAFTIANHCSSLLTRSRLEARRASVCVCVCAGGGGALVAINLGLTSGAAPVEENSQ